MPPQIFDRQLRHIRFARAERMSRDDRWLVERMALGVIERLEAVSRPLRDALVIGMGWDILEPELSRLGVAARVLPPGTDEDMPFAEAASTDVIIACGTLDTVNDLPGALALARRTLRPGGLFLGSMSSAGSLAGLRALVTAAEHGGPASARFHPMVDVRAAGDLLTRAGFVLPVTESETLKVTYRSLDRLLHDIRGAAFSNCLASRTHLPRANAQAIKAQFSAPFAEQYNFVNLTGWSPEP